LLELVVVLALLTLLLAVLSPAIAKTKPVGQATQCLNNLRQLTAAWRMYSENNNDSLVYNRDGGSTGKTYPNWVAGWLDFSSTNPDNTNISYLIQHDSLTYSNCGFLGPYIKTASAFKCPADESVVQPGGQTMPRVRSYSMNNYVGVGTRTWTSPSAYPIFQNYQDMPSPANVFILLDEQELSINDGMFFTDPDHVYQLIDYPAGRHGWAGGLSFGDGHSEIQRWRDPRTVPILAPSELLALDVNLPGDVDVVWLANHAVGKP